ncbi:TPA: hypothetical protein VAT20_000041 [Streptococcus agalactiae]|nr:hypothetical protein [Streptococcus agalactiae]
MAEFMLYLGILLNLLYLGLAITAVIYLIKIYKLLSEKKSLDKKRDIF